MATFLDITGLQYFTSLFVFILSWAIVFSALTISKMFAGNKVIPALISFVLAIFVVLNPLVFDIVKSVSPWIALAFVLVMLLLPTIQILIPELAESAVGARAGFLMLIVFVVVIGVLVKVRGAATVPGDEGAGEEDFSKVSNVLLNPTMLGAILLLLVAVLTVALLTAKAA